jgi:hypothetical protein
MLTMLKIRPGTVWRMLYCSASRTRSAFKNGEPERYNGTTMPPGNIGRGAYAESVAGAGAGTAKGAGSGGSHKLDSPANSCRIISLSRMATVSGEHLMQTRR